MKQMQHMATKVFIGASVAFGVLGLLRVLVGFDAGDDNSLLNRLFFGTVFIILPSFALSVAGKYLSDR